MKKIILLVVVSICFWSLSYAQEWQFVAESELGEVWYVKTKSMTKIASNVVRAWVKCEIPDKYSAEIEEVEKQLEHDKGNPFLYYREANAYVARDKEPTKIIYLFEFNCKERMSRDLQFTSYRYDGKVLFNGNTPKTWSYVVPGSVAEGILNWICSRAKGN